MSFYCFVTVCSCWQFTNLLLSHEFRGHSKLDFLWARFWRLLVGNFHTILTTLIRIMQSDDANSAGFWLTGQCTSVKCDKAGSFFLLYDIGADATSNVTCNMSFLWYSCTLYVKLGASIIPFTSSRMIRVEHLQLASLVIHFTSTSQLIDDYQTFSDMPFKLNRH